MVKAGDTVEADQSLITLESDKASMEIPSPASGVVESVSIKVGDEVGTGDLILKLKVEGAAPAAEEQPAAAPAQAAAPAAEQKPAAAALRQPRPIPRLRSAHPAATAPRSMPARRCACWRASSASS